MEILHHFFRVFQNLQFVNSSPAFHERCRPFPWLAACTSGCLSSTFFGQTWNQSKLLTRLGRCQMHAPVPLPFLAPWTVIESIVMRYQTHWPMKAQGGTNISQISNRRALWKCPKISPSRLFLQINSQISTNICAFGANTSGNVPYPIIPGL